MPVPSDRSESARGVDPPAAASGGDATVSRPGTAAGPRRALAAVADALCAATLSMDAVRDAAVRYGSAARARAVGPDEMVTALHGLLRRCAQRHAPALRAELEASVPWWAIHGYHRAD
jgi:hypothetical protein